MKTLANIIFWTLCSAGITLLVGMVLLNIYLVFTHLYATFTWAIIITLMVACIWAADRRKRP